MTRHSFFNIPGYLNLKDIGGLELVFALTPLLSGFSWRDIPLSVLMWLLLIVMSFFKKGKFHLFSFIPLTLFIIYWLLHEMVIMLVDDVNLNGVIAQVIYFSSVYILCSVLDMKKLRGSLNWVALLSIGGLLYQWIIISSGGGVHPLEIPGLTMSLERLESLTVRPSSFFMEPAAYVAYMICPLALSMMDRKWGWSALIILSIFLTTSTTGIVLSFLLLAASLFIGRAKTRYILAVLVLSGGLFYALSSFDAFEVGIEKIENTDTETNVRLVQGAYIVRTMHPGEFIFGVPYSSPYNYCMSGRAPQVVFYGNSVFMSTFWYMILCYGVVGLFLYFLIYWKILRMNLATLPFIICLIAVMFSSGYAIGGSFVFTLIFLLTIVRSGYYHLTNS